jgi:hypothetical protein
MNVRHLTLFFGLALAASSAAEGMTVQAQLTYGSRQIRDGRIKSVFGKSPVVGFSLQAHLGKHLFAGVDFEHADRMSGIIGAYLNPAEFQMRGLDIFGGLEYGAKLVSVYAKAGLGFYDYHLSIQNNPFTAAYPVNRVDLGGMAAVGVQFFPISKSFLVGEVKYVYLRVKPYEDRVDLSGLRLSAGFGIRL